MMIRRNRLKLFFTLIVLGLLLGIHGAATAVPEVPQVPEEITAGPQWGTPVNITSVATAPYGARFPDIAVSGNGYVLVGFLRQQSADSSDTAIYYRISLDNGQSWLPGLSVAPGLIYGSPGVRSTELDLAFDGNNTAHAVWREGDNTPITILYSPQSRWGTATPPTTLGGGGDLDVSDPVIFANGVGGTLDVVWRQNDNGQYSLQHRRSVNGGSSWTISSSLPRPDLTARSDMFVIGNTIHLVWEEGILIPTISGAKIYYARGFVSGGGVNWQGPVQISPNMQGGQIVNAKQPQITVVGGKLSVTYTNRQSTETQFANYAECAANCLAAANWQTTTNISGQFVSVHASDPFDMITALDSMRGCTMAYFHGVISGQGEDDNEQILGSNSCSGWAQSAPDMVTSFNVRSINPDMVVVDDWFVYLTFQETQRVPNTNPPEFEPPQVRFIRNEPAIYLPVMSR